MRDEGGTPERRIAVIGATQHGCVTRRQLLAAGLSPAGIGRRVRAGTLLVEYRGTYRVGHRAPSVQATCMAAVLACGRGALLYRRSAAHIWGLLRQGAREPEVLARTSRRIPGIRCVRARGFDPRDGQTLDGIPVTTVARTLVDLAAVLPRSPLGRAFHQARVLHRTTPAEVEAVLARRPSSPGATILRRVLRGDRVVLSKVEERFLALLAEEGLPLPRTNWRVGGRWLDCHWPDYKLVVELDSYTYHGSRHAWEEDHRRERLVRARGEEFRRYTHDDVMVAPSLMLRELRDLLDGIPSRSRKARRGWDT